MAELADALVLGSGVYDVQVQVLLSALNNKNPNLFSTGERVRIFGFLQQSKTIKNEDTNECCISIFLSGRGTF